MKRNGVVVGLLIICLTFLVCTPVSAFRSETTYASKNEMKYRLVCENVDYWSTGQQYAIYITLTLLDVGIVIGFESITCEINMTTEIEEIQVQTIDEPWNEVGDMVHFMFLFTLTSEQVNNSSWDIYEAHFYYQVNQSVILDGGQHQNCYTNPHEISIGVSTLSFWTLWPYPPIFLMMGIYYSGFFLLRKFNKRYQGLDEVIAKETATESDGQKQAYPSDNYD